MDNFPPIVIVSGRHVVASGSVVFSATEIMSITPLPGGAFPLSYHFFFTDTPQATAAYEVVTGLNNNITIKIETGNSPSLSTRAPLLVGQIGAQSLYLEFAISTVGDAPNMRRIFDYTFSTSGAPA